MLWDIHLVNRGHLSQLHLLASCSPPELSLRWQSEKEKALMLCKDCSLIAKTLVCYQHWFGHLLKMQHCWTTMKKMSQIFHPQLNPVHAESAQTAFTLLLISRPLHLSSCTELNVQTSRNTLASSAQETDFSLSLMKTWMFRSWLEMLHPAVINQDFLLVISPVI